MLITDTGAVTERLQVREIDDSEGQRLVRIDIALAWLAEFAAVG